MAFHHYQTRASMCYTQASNVFNIFSIWFEQSKWSKSIPGETSMFFFGTGIAAGFLFLNYYKVIKNFVCVSLCLFFLYEFFEYYLEFNKLTR